MVQSSKDSRIFSPKIEVTEVDILIRVDFIKIRNLYCCSGTALLDMQVLASPSKASITRKLLEMYWILSLLRKLFGGVTEVCIHSTISNWLPFF